MSTSPITIDQIRATVDQLTTQLAQYVQEEDNRSQSFAKTMGAKGNLEAIDSAVNTLQKGDSGEDADVSGMGLDIVSQILLKKQKELDVIKNSLKSAKDMQKSLEIVGTPLGKRN